MLAGLVDAGQRNLIRLVGCLAFIAAPSAFLIKDDNAFLFAADNFN